ncbi:MAG: (d)CMP kinase [Schwartzia sp.]|nr:(d)CMP kinase [Schwartzia sp. (in: firmicutes)]
MKKLVLAIDGPAGAGKSTIAKLVAEKLGYVYIDTGAMYRAVAWKVLQTGQPVTDENIIQTAKDIDVRLRYESGALRVEADGTDVTESIRTPEVTGIVSQVARLLPVREKMVTLQRKMAENGGVVMDGRDIASKVLPGADVKVFLTASIEERATRRWREMKDKGYDVSMEKLKEEIAARDKMDTEREVSPLVRVPEAELLDTTGMTIDEVVAAVLALCR